MKGILKNDERNKTPYETLLNSRDIRPYRQATENQCQMLSSISYM